MASPDSTNSWLSWSPNGSPTSARIRFLRFWVASARCIRSYSSSRAWKTWSSCPWSNTRRTVESWEASSAVLTASPLPQPCPCWTSPTGCWAQSSSPPSSPSTSCPQRAVSCRERFRTRRLVAVGRSELFDVPTTSARASSTLLRSSERASTRLRDP